MLESTETAIDGEDQMNICNDIEIDDNTSEEVVNTVQNEQSISKRARKRQRKPHTKAELETQKQFKQFVKDKFELVETIICDEDAFTVTHLCEVFEKATNLKVLPMHASAYIQSLFHPRIRFWGDTPKFINLREKTLRTRCLEAIVCRNHQKLLSYLKKIHTENCLEKFLLDDVIWMAITEKMITRDELLTCGWVVTICQLTLDNIPKTSSASSVTKTVSNLKWNAIKNSKPQEPAIEGFDYDALLLSCKKFFHPRIKVLPCHASKLGSENNNSGGALPFTAKNVLPRLQEIYGSFEYFFRCLLGCSETKQWMKAILDAQEESLNLRLHEEIQNARQLGRAEAIEEMKNRFHIAGPILQEGCGISKNGYMKQKSIVELESFESAYQRELSKEIHLRRAVPAILLSQQQLVLSLLNETLLPLISTNSKIVWKTVARTLAQLIAVRVDANPKLIAWLFDTVNTYTHLKTLYLSQANWQQSWTDQIKERGVMCMTVSEWSALQPSLGEHAPYILRQAYNNLTKYKVRIRRRHILLFGSIPLDVYPSIELNSEKIKKLYLGGEKLGDPDPAATMDYVEFIHHIKNGKIYIGKLCQQQVTIKTKEQKAATIKQASYRLWDISKRLLEGLIKMINHKWLRLSETTITLYFTNWWDGATVLASGLLIFLLGFAYDDSIFNENASFERVTAMRPWLLGFLPEEIDTVEKCREIAGKMFSNLATTSYVIDVAGVKYTFHFVPSLDRADNAAASKGVGNKCGGHYRCNYCAANFSKEQECLLLSFTHQVNLPHKDLRSIVDFVAKEGKLKDIGLRKLPPLLCHNIQTPLKDRNLHDLHLGVDNLHNAKGAIKFFLTVEQEQQGWQENIFISNLYKIVGRTTIATMKGVDWRFLCVAHKDVIMPAVSSHRPRKQILELWSMLSEIIWLSYTKPWVQKRYPAARIRLHVLCFLFGIHAKELYGSKSKEGILFIHNIHMHYAPFFEVSDFRNASTEPGEAYICSLKMDMLNFSNRHHEDAILTTVVRDHYESFTSSFWSVHCDNSKILNYFKTKQFEEISIPGSIVHKYEDDACSFLAYLAKYEYHFADHWTIDSDGGILFQTKEQMQHILTKQLEEEC